MKNWIVPVCVISLIAGWSFIVGYIQGMKKGAHDQDVIWCGTLAAAEKKLNSKLLELQQTKDVLQRDLKALSSLHFNEVFQPDIGKLKAMRWKEGYEYYRDVMSNATVATNYGIMTNENYWRLERKLTEIYTRLPQ